MEMSLTNNKATLRRCVKCHKIMHISKLSFLNARCLNCGGATDRPIDEIWEKLEIKYTKSSKKDLLLRALIISDQHDKRESPKELYDDLVEIKDLLVSFFAKIEDE